MTGLLISDLRDPGSAAHPATALKNPLCLMTENAAHGGNWRCAYPGQDPVGTVLFAYRVSRSVRWPGCREVQRAACSRGVTA